MYSVLLYIRIKMERQFSNITVTCSYIICSNIVKTVSRMLFTFRKNFYPSSSNRYSIPLSKIFWKIVVTQNFLISYLAKVGLYMYIILDTANSSIFSLIEIKDVPSTTKYYYFNTLASALFPSKINLCNKYALNF